ncbi:MAG: glycine betaine/L-proline ABC transporter substrate-binding protein ProX [Oscillatoria sp. SIO1A7]|nr:glycine betaine/L-proline ABC transporter substrate-binding protein ProX [Oscillatoria sp. SIO1A7]
MLHLLSSTSVGKFRKILEVILDPFQLYTIPLDKWVSAVVDFFVNNFRPLFQAIRLPISLVLDGIQGIFLSVPPLILLVILGCFIWQIAGRGVAIYSTIALIIIGFLGTWQEAMISLAIVTTAVLFCVAIGLPLGLACARSDRVERSIRPILDGMQTMPSFVYLVPIVMLFGIGSVPGVIVTIVFAVPPLIRLTNLGIRQVPSETVEAGIAFGSTPRQMLWNVQIPLAMPTILAGLNQAILLALSMSVITSMIAVEGLGQMVLKGVGRLDVGLASVGGIGIVLIAVMLDRITRSLGEIGERTPWQKRGPASWLVKQPKYGLAIGTAIAIVLLSLIVYPQLTPQTTTKSGQSTGTSAVVQVGTSTSEYAAVILQILKIGLEELGYEFKPPKQLSVPALYLGTNNGDLDLYATSWENMHRSFYQQYKNNGTVEYSGNLVENALQGYQIDLKTAEKYKITSIEQLKDPKIAKIFDSDGDGKANLIGCIPGWSCEKVIEHHLDTYGLRDTVEHDQGEYSAMIAAAIAGYKQGKPLLFYTWTPYWLGSALKVGEEVLWLEVPFTSLPESMGNMTEEDTTSNGKNTGFPVDRIRILSNREFLEANPSAKRFFELVNIPIDYINEQQRLVYEGEDDPADIRRHAEEWIENNREQFQGWIEEARQAE